MNQLKYPLIIILLPIAAGSSLKINREIGITPDIARYKQDNNLVFQFALTDLRGAGSAKTLSPDF